MELGQLGVDVLGVVAGLIDTPAMRGSGIIMGGSQFVAMEPDDAVDEALAALGSGTPVHVAGDQNREMSEMLWPVARPELVAAMTEASASLYGLAPPERPKAH